MIKDRIKNCITYLYLNDDYRLMELLSNIKKLCANKTEADKLINELADKSMIGVIHNYKGDVEYNYLLTGKRLRSQNRDLFAEVFADSWAEKYFAPGKKAYFVRLDSRREVMLFLSGEWNTGKMELKNEDYFENSNTSLMSMFKIMFRREAV